jgi:hypothetical protein
MSFDMNQEDFSQQVYTGDLIPLYTKANIDGMFTKHITLDFKKGNCRFPEGMSQGQHIDIKIVGELDLADVSAYQVEISLKGRNEWVTHQVDSDTPLHITMECRNGVSPVMAGIKLRDIGMTKAYSENEYKYGSGTLAIYHVDA